MPKKYALIVFDWDGTVGDSIGHIAECIRTACGDLGLTPPTPAAARHVIGLGLHEAMQALYPAMSGDAIRQLADRYRYHYVAGKTETPLFEGAAETLRELDAAGHVLAVATGKTRRGLERAMEAAGVRRYFTCWRTADVCPSKPHPAMLEEIMAETGIGAGRTVMVGDTSHDLLMARNAGVDSLAAAYGAHEGGSLQQYGPVASFATFGGLSEWLLRHA